MSQAPAMPVFTDALIGDTTHLTTAEFGAYCLLLFVTWRNNGQPLPDDNTRLARVCRMTAAQWQKVRPTMAEFFDLSDGTWRQKRLEKEWNFLSEKLEKNRDNGKRGGRPKSLNNRETTKANGSVSLNPNHNPNESTQTQTQEEEITVTEVETHHSTTDSAKDDEGTPPRSGCMAGVHPDARTVVDRYHDLRRTTWPNDNRLFPELTLLAEASAYLLVLPLATVLEVLDHETARVGTDPTAKPPRSLKAYCHAMDRASRQSRTTSTGGNHAPNQRPRQNHPQHRNGFCALVAERAGIGPDQRPLDGGDGDQGRGVRGEAGAIDLDPSDWRDG